MEYGEWERREASLVLLRNSQANARRDHNQLWREWVSADLERQLEIERTCTELRRIMVQLAAEIGELEASMGGG